MLDQKTVLITGGAGFLGKALTHYILEHYPKVKKLRIFSRDELKHHYMNWDFVDKQVPVEYMIGDIRDLERVEQAMQGVDIVIHAAALKQVGACENNPEECYKTNVSGTQNVIKSAKRHGVSQTLLISSDKAVDPVSVYGNSKQAAEKLFISANNSDQKFSILRLGNLIGSTGSVVPIFQHMAKKGAVPVTHPEMTRFAGNVSEAVKSIMYTLEKMRGGEIFIPQWKAFKIDDLVDVIAPGCVRKIIGLRKYEKMHESLFSGVEAERVLSNGRYFIVPEAEMSIDDALDAYGAIEGGVDEYASNEIERFRGNELRSLLKLNRVASGHGL